MTITDPGYAIVPECLSADECDGIEGALGSDQINRSRAGARHLMSVPAVAELAISDKLVRIARNFLGVTAIPFRATLFEKSRRTNWLIPWHQDTALPMERRFDAAGWGPWSEKSGTLYAHAPAWAVERVVALRVHLDASTCSNGPLRVVPGSHVHGVLPDASVMRLAAGDSVECLAPRGGVIAMRPLLIHASSKAQSDDPRRVLHIEFAGSLDLGAGIQLAIV